MTLSEVAAEVARRTGAPKDLVWGFLQEALTVVTDGLDAGESIRIRGLGRLDWVKRSAKKLNNPVQGPVLVGEGLKLRFQPATRFKKRRKNHAGKRRRNEQVRGGDK